MKIVLLGKDGKLGSAIFAKLVDNYDVIGFNKKELDITDSRKLKKELLQIFPDIIINAAAYTDVDNSEVSKEKALKVNSEALNAIIESALIINSFFIHFSTDYVFNGKKKFPYLETDKPNPINVYGKSKLSGEKKINAYMHNFLILRTSWVMGTKGNNFVSKILLLF